MLQITNESESLNVYNSIMWMTYDPNHDASARPAAATIPFPLPKFGHR
jgi:hypothetical protein